MHTLSFVGAIGASRPSALRCADSRSKAANLIPPREKEKAEGCAGDDGQPSNSCLPVAKPTTAGTEAAHEACAMSLLRTVGTGEVNKRQSLMESTLAQDRMSVGTEIRYRKPECLPHHRGFARGVSMRCQSAEGNEAIPALQGLLRLFLPWSSNLMRTSPARSTGRTPGLKPQRLQPAQRH